MSQDQIILHNYPQSPVAEKVRVALGIKGLVWHSVEIPRLPPKPLLLPLTGGYRRTPVMQIGADIYCDSQCIINELEQRFPTPSFFPTKDGAFLWMLGRLIDEQLFTYTVKIVLGSGVATLPPEFAQDRGRLYLGPDWVQALQKANSELPHLVAQMAAYLSAIDSQIADGRGYLSGEAPAQIDAHLYHLIWFLRGRWDQGPKFLGAFTHLCAWEGRIQAIGHGHMSTLSGLEALAIAESASPKPLPPSDSDHQGLTLGKTVTICPDVDAGETPITGTVAHFDTHRVTLALQSADLGALQVHFPRSGYRVTPL